MGALLGCLLIASALGAGDPAPEPLEGVGLDGKRVSLPLSGQVTIVDFFATWCKPCRAALEDYPRLIARFGDRVRLIVVDVEEPRPTVKAFFARNPLPSGVTVVVDPLGQAASAFGAASFPSFYLLDRSGVVRHVLRGWGRGSAETLLESTDRLLAIPNDKNNKNNKNNKKTTGPP